MSALTNREQQCLQLTQQAARPKVIASKLGIGLSTVHEYVKRARKKCGIKSTLQASVDWALAADPLPITAKLTDKQISVLRMTAHGHGMKATATKLDISLAAVRSRTYLSRVALGAKSTREAVVLAIRQGLI
jgi:DNA-binding CsgD family transcriptional regulator